MAFSRKRKRGQEVVARKIQKKSVFSQHSDQDSTLSYDSDNEGPVALGSTVSSEDEKEEMNEGGESRQIEEQSSDTTSRRSAQTSAGHASRRPPTAQEIRDIKDATDLYRSNSFKFQIDALLPNVRPKFQHSAPLDRFLTSLHACLGSLKPIASQHPLEASKELLKKGVVVPYSLPLPTQQTNWKVAFERPSEILVAGSWPNKLSVKAKDKQKFVVDLAVEIPSSLLQEKDYLNGRFFHKRAYYLAVIAAAILDKKNKLHADVSYVSANGDPRLTCLVVRPQEGSANDLTKLNAEVRIIATLTHVLPIPSQRLSPKKANIRTTTPSESAAEETPSPIYNNAILLTTTPKAHLLRAHALKQKVPAYNDALGLLRVWANQRGYSTGSKLCIRGFEAMGPWWAAVLDLLISGEEPCDSSFSKSAKRKPLGKGLSSYQLFRAAVDFLARHNFSREHIFVKSEKRHQFSREEYGTDTLAFVDAASVNLLASIPHGSLDMLQYDANATLDVLNENYMAQDPFREVFLKDCRDLQSRFDIVIRVDLSSAKLRSPSLHSILDNGSLYNALLSTMLTILRQALGNRTTAIVCLHPPSNERSTLEAHPADSTIVFVGLVLDVEHAFRLVDHGPAASESDPAAAHRFRDFWGDKAELRRFKDGSIVESVVWDVKTSDERTRIPYYICRHILGRHCGIPQDDVQHWQDSFDGVLRLPESITSVYQAAKSETGFKAALSAFDGLVKGIKALDDELPLAVLNLSPITDILRHTSVFTPTALTASASASLPRCVQYLQPMEVIIEFERSGRWPDDLRAIQKVKLAMFERLASKLMEKTPGLKATVVVGGHPSTSDIQDVACLEIMTPQGWAFSARIWHDREASLLDNAIDDKLHIPKHVKRNLPGGPDPKLRRAAVEAKEVYVRRFVHAPRHHRAVAALSHRHTAYAGTVRLVKRWLASHWILRGYLSGEAVELVCAAVFLGGAPRSTTLQQPAVNVPGTKERGFSRVVELLKDWKWEEGISVPIYGDEQNGGDAVHRAVVTVGGIEGVWRISTEFDPDGHMWTRNAPDAVMARRIQTIADATWRYLQNLETGNLDVTILFAHSVQQYDFIIELNPALLPRYYQNVNADPTIWARKGKYANAQSTKDEIVGKTQPGYDPVSLLFDDLSRVYKDTFMLFHDPLGGDRFGGVWDPRLKEPRPFKILGRFSAIGATKETSKDKSMVVLNKEAVLSEVERIGAGLITGITQHV